VVRTVVRDCDDDPAASKHHLSGSPAEKISDKK
jgi:hypothetical protein